MADEGRSITVTIKYGKGYEDSWVTFRGDPEVISGDIVSFFGLDCDTLTGVTPSELVVEATHTAQGAMHVVRGLDARIVPSRPTKTADGPREAAQGHPKSSAPVQPLLDQIQACKSTDDLKRLWAENQMAFGDEAVMNAWKARGRALAGS
ncbi:hypothetical protein [Streptomyces chrestomyceticus]|uniref:hypothetical protein n=1 Tax=Streptomyces chrestomyceticus TaxID=68185 RepID=UPI00340A48ED